jgi:2-oxoglutarate ferredoxin oxidoreductase subunit gamma
MTERIIIAGSGGQGIMLLGKILAEAAMRENKFVTWFPSYGAEVRGGTAYCMVVISDKEIGSPYVDKADTLIIMNGPSSEKFKNRLRAKGLLIVNSSLAAGNSGARQAKEFPFTDLAAKMGNIKVANMLALGVLIACKNIVKETSVREAINGIAPSHKRDLIAINEQALKEGMRLK